MRNFKVGKTWGVLGKQQTYYGPTHFMGEKVPLNNNPFNAWDYKKSNYRRIDGKPADAQQGGVVPQVSPTPDVSPTPTNTGTPTPTPTTTTTQTPTNTPTPTTTTTLTSTPTQTPTNTPTPSVTPQVQWNAEVGFYAGYSINSNNWLEIGYPTEGYLTFSTLASNGTRWAATGVLETGFLPRTFYSNNGSAWITGNNSPFTFMSSTFDLTSNGEIFILGGSASYTDILTNGWRPIGYSYDGITYSAGTITVDSGRALPSTINSTAFNGDMWIGAGFSSGATANRTVLINSYDGINWSGQTNTFFTSPTSINSIAYGNGRWVATSNVSGNGRIAISYDGFNWSASTNASNSTIFGTSVSINNVIWFNDKFIATANASGATTHTVCYSYDGFNWSAATSTKTLISGVISIASNKSNFVMIGGNPGGAVYQSPDGINWSANTTNQSVVFNNGAINKISNKQPEQQSPNPSQTPSQTPTNTSTPTNTQTPTPSGVPFDSDAASFLSAVLTAGGTGITSTVSAATNTLFTQLKSNGLYNDLYFYPMIGGVSNSVALFGKRTSGTTYDISWSGNPLTFNASGATGNASGYGNTKLSRAIYSNLGDFSFGCYISGNDAAAFGYELGTAGGTDRNLLIVRYINGSAFVGTGNGFKTGVNPGALGMYIATQTGATGTVKIIKNGSTTLVNTSNSDNQFDGNDQWVLRGQEFSVRTMSFAVFSKYYTDAQVQTLSNIINTFQTSLGRNTY